MVFDALSRLEAEYDVRVIAARDTGSRAWGLADPDSDYDVGFVFAQSAAAYGKLGEYRASIDTRERDVELHGWNVKRFGELLADSNPSALELVHSPVSYTAHPAFDALAEDVAFAPLSLYHHYRSLAETNAARIRTGTATVKTNLYRVRGYCYARYVLDTHAFPELDFPRFLEEEADRFDEAVLTEARTLVDRKRAGEGEVSVGDAFGELSLPSEVDPREHAVEPPDIERINAFIESALAH
ncbi:nucleotidyltransferase domain-containing protein [Natronomonas sp. EA1]|uniref:nucleotidyltransferase domain-containing protein n=1 Tax=Natronomonas sp. EA1 TaxID=3421655 RepID=UPI003EB779B0